MVLNNAPAGAWIQVTVVQEIVGKFANRRKTIFLGHSENKIVSNYISLLFSDSYEDSLKDEETRKRTLPSSGRNHGFRRSIRNSRPRQIARHSFSGVRDDLIQQSPRMGPRPRGNSFRYSVSDLERRLHNLEQSFREPFHLKGNSRC